jgi:hypothetical protein
VTAEDLLIEIANAFPPMEMPSSDELSFHAHGCHECQFLREDLEALRGKPIDGELIRLIHMEMSCLSAKAWRWIAPHYIRYCLSPEAYYNATEAEFLVYNLGPEDRFKVETLQRLSLLDTKQIHCFIAFMEYLSNHEHWSEYFPENICRASCFLEAIEQSRTTSP